VCPKFSSMPRSSHLASIFRFDLCLGNCSMSKTRMSSCAKR
jgi:hypothetical protein